MKNHRNGRASGLNLLAESKSEESFDLCAASLVIHAAGDGEEKKGPRKFTMSAYNGGPMDLAGWYRPVVIDLSGIKGADKTRPIFLNHDPSQIVGHSTSIKVTAKGISVEGVISGTGEAAKEVLANHDNGFPWQASVGAKATSVERVEEGSTVTVNGQSYNGPINVARQCLLGEVSFVPLGADDSTSARIAAKAANGVSMTFEQWLKAKGFALADLNDRQKSALEAAYKAETKEPEKKPEAKVEASATTKTDDGKNEGEIEAKADPKTDAAGDYRKEIAAERKRVAAIDKAAAKHPEIAAKAIEENWSLDKVELEVLRASRPTGTPYVNTGAGAAVTTEIVASAIARSAGVNEKFAFSGLKDNEKEIAASKQFRGFSLHQAMCMIAATNGIHMPSHQVDDDFLKAMFRHDESVIRAGSGGYSTMSLSGITENILNKAMLEAYGTVPSVVPDICFETDTNDFKTFKRYRLTASGAFKTVTPAGELQNLSLQDESYSNQVTTKGCVIPISRNILINDDMGALTQVPTVIGRQGAIARENAVFTALVGNAGSFFGATNKNNATGAGSALSITSLTTAVQKLIEMKDANGDPIMLMPDRLLVPPALYATGENLFNSQYLIAGALGATNSKSLDPSNNIHKGKYRPIVSPFLGAASPVAGGSDTAWYLLTNPAGGMATVQVGYLRGQRTPVIERGEANFNTLGIAFRAFYDFGVALHDFRCGILSAGA